MQSKREYHVILVTQNSYYVMATDSEQAADDALDEAAYEHPDLDFDVEIVEYA